MIIMYVKERKEEEEEEEEEGWFHVLLLAYCGIVNCLGYEIWFRQLEKK